MLDAYSLEQEQPPHLSGLKTIRGNQTMSKANRTRIDYTPGRAAVEALQAAQELHPRDNTQALIDRLVIVGLSVLAHPPWKLPNLWGNDRDRWKLPESLRPSEPEEAR